MTTFTYYLCEGIELEVECDVTPSGNYEVDTGYEDYDIENVVCTLGDEEIDVSGLFMRPFGKTEIKPVIKDIEEKAFEQWESEQ